MEHKNPHATHVLKPKTRAPKTRHGETLEFIHKNINARLFNCVCCVCVLYCCSCDVFSCELGALLNMPVNKFLRSIKIHFADSRGCGCLQLSLNLANF